MKVREKYVNRPVKTHRTGHQVTSRDGNDSLQQLRVMLASRKSTKPDSEYLSLGASSSLQPPIP
jgi:hypothetical protein